MNMYFVLCSYLAYADLPSDPLTWGAQDVQKYLADAGFREVAAQLREEVRTYIRT